jgi:hypothetical protein
MKHKSPREEDGMTHHVDASDGWCCDGRTYQEHASADGQCCQPQGMQIEDLPADGQEKARERLTQGS